MFKVDDRVRETSVTVGAGTYTLAGAPVGFQAFISLGANNYCPYYATDDVNWETGIGRVLSAPDRLERTTIFASSNADAAVNWGAGTKKLRCGMPAQLAFPKVAAIDVSGGAGTQVLTQAQQRAGVMLFTGALTGNRTIEVDDTPWQWGFVWNGTTGNFTLSIKVTGSAFAEELFQQRKVGIAADGTNLFKVADDAPPGTFEDYAGGAVQQGRLLCDGSNVSRTNFSGLFNKIGTTYGAGDGSTTFGLPDLRRRVAVGSGGSGTAQLGNAVGNTGGAENRTIGTTHLPASGLSIPSLSIPSISVTSALQVIRADGSGTTDRAAGGGGTDSVGTITSTGSSSTSTGTTGNMGSGNALDEMQPSLVVLKTIRY